MQVQAMWDEAVDTLCWREMHEDISKFNKSCVTCQKIAPSQPHSVRFESYIPNMPFESTAAQYFDLVGGITLRS